MNQAPRTNNHSDQMKTNNGKVVWIARVGVLALPLCMWGAVWQYCEPWAGPDNNACGSTPDCDGTCIQVQVIQGPSTGGWCVPNGVWCSENASGTITCLDTPYNCVENYLTCVCGGIQQGDPWTDNPQIMCK